MKKSKKQCIDEKMFSFYLKGSVKCKYCGHTIFMVRERGICTHCGHWNYRTKKDEFKYRTKETLIKEKRKDYGNKFKCN